MSPTSLPEAQWEEPRAPRRKGSKWLWLLVGCSGVVGLLVVAFVFLFLVGRHAIDQEAQWGDIAEVLPLRGSPPEFFVLGAPRLWGTKCWSFIDEKGRQGILIYAPGETGLEERKGVLDPRASSPLGDSVDPTVAFERSSLVVQGRTLNCVRYQSRATKQGFHRRSRIGMGGDPRITLVPSGPTILVDLSPDGSQAALLLALAHPDTTVPIEDADVVEFLAPFRVDEPLPTPRRP